MKQPRDVFFFSLMLSLYVGFFPSPYETGDNFFFLSLCRVEAEYETEKSLFFLFRGQEGLSPPPPRPVLMTYTVMVVMLTML